MVKNKFIAVFVCAAACGAFLVANFGPLKLGESRAAILPGNPGGILPTGPAVHPVAPGPDGQSPNSIQRGLGVVVSTVRPAVVSISARTNQTPQPGARGLQFLEPFPGRTSSVGSGVIVSPTGYILTSRQVVGNASVLRVQLFRSGQNTVLAHRLATDPATDLVLLRLPFSGNLPYATLGDSSRVRTGDLVIALGTPFGLSSTATQGIVSTSRREVTLAGRAYTDVIQTDASINQGNAGGPLVNISAEVIGINIALYSTNASSAGIGFAVRSNRALAFINRTAALVR